MVTYQRNDGVELRATIYTPPGWTPDVQLVTRWICGHDDRRATPPLLPDYQVEAWGIVVHPPRRSHEVPPRHPCCCRGRSGEEGAGGGVIVENPGQRRHQSVGTS